MAHLDPFHSQIYIPYPKLRLTKAKPSRNNWPDEGAFFQRPKPGPKEKKSPKKKTGLGSQPSKGVGKDPNAGLGQPAQVKTNE